MFAKRFVGFVHLVIVVVGVALVATLMPSQVQAAPPGVGDEPVVVMDREEPTRIIGEVMERRTESTKTFRVSDGSFRVVGYPTPVHVKDAAGRFQDIDNSFTLTSRRTSSGVDGVFENTRGSQVVTVAPVARSFSETDLAVLSSRSSTVKDELFGTVSVGVAGRVVSWGYDGVQPGRLEWDTPVDRGSLSGDDRFVTLTGLTRSGVFREAFPGVDLQYSVSPVGVKENLVLKDRGVKGEWTARFSIGDLTAVQTDEHTVSLRDTHGVVVLVVSAPFMEDAAGRVSDGVSLRMSVQGSVMTVAIVADPGFLSARSTVFPVVVDPVFTTPQSAFSYFDTLIGSDTPGVNYGLIGSTNVGYESSVYGKARALVRLQNLPMLPAGSVIIQAQLAQYGYTNGVAGSLTVEAHRVTGSWTEQGATWANSSTLFDPTVEDYVTMPVGMTSDAWFTWDLTRLMKQWYENPGQYPNNGVMLMAPDQEANSASPRVAKLYSCDHPTVSWKPYFVVSYRNNAGLENYWSYHSQSINGGTGFVNDYSGNLVFTVPAVVTTGFVMPVGVALVYNGYASDQQYRNKTKGSVTGAGWMLTVGQRVEKVSAMAEYASIATGLALNGFDYVWIDQDGTHHFFAKEASGYYLDEDGLGLSLTINQTIDGLTGMNILESLDGVKMAFDSAGYLKAIVNPLGQKVTLAYAGSNLSSITDGAGRQISFAHSGSSVTSITGPDGTTSLAYSGDQLSQVSFADGSKITFTYSPVITNSKTFSRLAGVTGRDGIKMGYGYASSGGEHQLNRVTSVREYATDGEPGHQLVIDFSRQNETRFSYDKPTGSVHETYQFDHMGRIVSALNGDGSTTPTSGGDPWSSGSLSYTPTSSVVSALPKNNKITRVGAGSRYVNNLLANHSAENGTAGWVVSNWTTTSSVHSLDTTNKYLGAQSWKITQDYPNPARAGWKQMNVAVTGNTTYTLSAYAKTETVTASGTGKGAALYVVEVNGLTREADTQILGTTDWQRLSLTFTTAATTTHVDVYLGLKYANGTVWFDAAQLEVGDTPSPYNLLENGDFSRPGGWNLTNPASGDGVGNGVGKLTGAPTVKRSLHQSIMIGQSGVGFYLSGRASATSAQLTANDRVFALTLGIHYADGTPTDWSEASFNADASGWQFACGLATPPESNRTKTISYVDVYLLYYQQVNQALFDDLMLTIDETGATYVYDAKGNVTRTGGSSGQSASVVVNNLNQVTQVNGSDGDAYSFTYDPSDQYRLVSLNDGVARVGMELTYGGGNSQANVTTARTGQIGAVVSSPYTETGLEYSANGAYVSAELDERGLRASYAVDSATGRITSFTDPNNNTTSYAYDAATKALSTVTTGASSVAYVYDMPGTGNRLKQITHNGFGYNFAYDKWANVQGVSIGSQVWVDNTFASGGGNLVRTTYGNGQRLDYGYDVHDRVTSVAADGRTLAEFAYDSDGRMAKINDIQNSGTISYSYSSTGDLLDLRNAQGRIQYGTNSDSTMTHRAVTLGGSSFNTVYTYAIGGRPETTTYPSGAQVARVSDQLGRSITTDIAVGAVSLRRADTYVDVAGNRTTHLIGSHGNYLHSGSVNTPIPGWTRFGYTYDNNGNIISITETDDANSVRTTTLEYDPLNQLIRVNDPAQNQTVKYTYDPGGNILSKTEYVYTTGMVGSPTGTRLYGYGSSGWKDQLTSYDGQSITYDEAGNPVSYRGGLVLSWQKGRQLASAKTPDGGTVVYVYNPQGIRVAKTSAEETVTYLVDEDGTVQAMQQGSDKLVFMYDSTGRRDGFVWYSGITLVGSYYYLYNAQGDVIGIVDGNFTPVAQYRYDPWGKPTKTADGSGQTINSTSRHIANINPFRYRSYMFDRETGLYYLQSRYYDPETMRFVNADAPESLSLLASTGNPTATNLFSYCVNNPVIFFDPDGHIFKYTLSSGRYSVSGVFEKAPSYSPLTWSSKTHYANCYAYALNIYGSVYDNKLQPGELSGKLWSSYSGTVAQRLVAAFYADLKAISQALGYKTNQYLCAWDWQYYGPVYGSGYKVALVTAPDGKGWIVDYHWYRQDSTGQWSHKRGLTAITNVDASGKMISNPQTANRNYPGYNYSQFVGYFQIYRYSIW